MRQHLEMYPCCFKGQIEIKLSRFSLSPSFSAVIRGLLHTKQRNYSVLVPEALSVRILRFKYKSRFQSRYFLCSKSGDTI